MSIPFLFTPRALSEGESHTLDEASSRHILRVLRMTPGEAVILSNGEGLCMEAAITAAGNKDCIVAVRSVREIPQPIPEIALGISFTKNVSRIEWFLEKATEIGVSAVYPITCKRTEKIHFKFPRFKQLMIAAMLQSQQYHLPVLHEPLTVENLIRDNTYAAGYIAHCEPGDKNLLHEVLVRGKSSLLLVGPEGDFTPEEIRLAKNNDFIPVSLGANRLRTETAGIVACALLNTIRPPGA
jgi:16S rRNA (uracil1498-N3)-methyltransferase